MKVTFNSNSEAAVKSYTQAMKNLGFVQGRNLANFKFDILRYDPTSTKEAIDVDLNEIGSIAREAGCSFSIEY